MQHKVVLSNVQYSIKQPKICPGVPYSHWVMLIHRSSSIKWIVLDYIRNFHLSQGNSHRLAKAFLLDYNMNVHHQVLEGKTQFFPTVCLALTISHSLHYLQLPHTLIASELTKYKLNSKVSPPLPVHAFSNLPLSFAQSGRYSHHNCSEAALSSFSWPWELPSHINGHVPQLSPSLPPFIFS